MLWEKNQFGGVVIDPESLSIDTNVFYTDLKQLIDDWRSDSVKLVWLKINTEFKPLKVLKLYVALPQSIIFNILLYVLILYILLLNS